MMGGSAAAVVVCFAALWGASRGQLLGGVPVSSSARDSVRSCINCTFVRNDGRNPVGTFVRTDNAGTVTQTFSCDQDPAARMFCADPLRMVIPSIVPDVTDVCRSMQPRRLCDPADLALSPVTVWGDVRTDPDYSSLGAALGGAAALAPYEAGDYRDVDAEDMALMGFRSEYTPKFSPTGARMGSPDLYAVSGHDYLRVLFGGPQVNPTAAGTPSLGHSSGASYANSNGRLLLYAGFQAEPLASAVARCSDVAGATNTGYYPACVGPPVLRYLTTHGGVRTADAIGLLSVTVEMFSYSAGSEAAIAALWAAEGCSLGAVECGRGMTAANGRLTVNSRMDPPGFGAGVSYRPAAPNAAGVEMVTSDFKDAQGVLVSYPMFVLRTLADFRTPGIVTWVEQSLNGITWEVHPESVSQDLGQYLLARDFAAVASRMTNVYMPVGDGSRGYVDRVFAPTGTNRYMRLLHARFHGTQHPDGANTDDDLAFWVPRTVFLAERLAGIRVYVPASLGASGDATAAMGFRAGCEAIPDFCSYFEPPQGVTQYPTQRVPAGGPPMAAAPEIRSWFKDTVLPEIYGCKGTFENPVEQFLKAPFQGSDVCVRTGAIDRVTCYRFTRRLVPGPAGPVTVETDVFRTFVRYVSPQVFLTVTIEMVRMPYPVPASIVGGPFTQTDRVPLAYVYRTPVKGGLQVDNTTWVTSAEACEFPAQGDPPLASMPQSETCECLDYPLSPEFCLCKGAGAVKRIKSNALPPGVTFNYPYHFTPQKFPTDFAMQSKRLVHTTQVHTAVDVDCEAFLCSGNSRCAEQLQTSNYLSFCRNQEIILRTTLNSLAGINEEVERSVDSFMQLNALPEGSSGLDDAQVFLPSLGSSSSSATQADPLVSGVSTSALTESLRTYAKSVASAGLDCSGFATAPAETVPEGCRSRSRSSNSGSGVASGGASSVVSQSDARSSVVIQAPDGYNYRNPLTTPGEAFGLAIIPAIGVGLLTEKVNTLAVGQQQLGQYIEAVEDYANYLGTQINDLAGSVSSGLQATSDAILKQAEAHNSLVHSINDKHQAQASFNLELASYVNQQSQFITQNTAVINNLLENINFLDLVGSRASTLGVQSASLMVLALDHQVRGREFAQRMLACSSWSSATAATCAGSSDSVLIGVFVRSQGPTHVIETLLLTPTKYEYAYAAPAFCYGGLHYAVREVTDTFVFVGGQIWVSPLSRYAPQNLSDSNSLKLSRCQDPRLIIEDLTPGVPSVGIDTTTVFGGPSLLSIVGADGEVISTSANLSLPQLSTLLDLDDIRERFGAAANGTAEPLPLVNVSGEIQRLRESIASIDAINITKLNVTVQGLLPEYTFTSGDTLSTYDIVLFVLFSGVVLALLAMALYQMWTSRGTRYVKV